MERRPATRIAQQGQIEAKVRGWRTARILDRNNCGVCTFDRGHFSDSMLVVDEDDVQAP